MIQFLLAMSRAHAPHKNDTYHQETVRIALKILGYAKGEAL
jgi:hypothetical protein